MLEGKRFLPDTGTPIWKMARRSVVFAVWLPEPLTVATWIVKSFVAAVNGTLEFWSADMASLDFRPNRLPGQALFPYRVVRLCRERAAAGPIPHLSLQMPCRTP